MADPAAAVTDTHPLLLHAAGSGTLGRQASRLFGRAEAREAIVYVPMAVIWETCLLARVRRIDLRRSAQQFFDDLFSNPAYQPIDLTAVQIFAAALSLDLPLVTRDATIRARARCGLCGEVASSASAARRLRTSTPTNPPSTTSLSAWVRSSEGLASPSA